MLLNYCFGALAGSGHLTTSFSFIVFRVPSGGSPSSGEPRDRVLICTVLFSRIERAPFGRNGWVIYQKGPSGARGFPEKNSSFFGTPEMPEKRPFQTMKVRRWKPTEREFCPRTGQIRTGLRPKWNVYSRVRLKWTDSADGDETFTDSETR